MKILHLAVLIPLSALAQQTPASPAPDTGALPVWVKAVPKPPPGPWRRLTGEERLVLYARETFGAGPLFGAAVGATLTFGLARPEEWPQDFHGYARRFGNNAAQHYIRSTAMHGIAALLREDNTYYPSGKTGAWARIGYAAGHAFMARGNDGNLRFSTSRFVGGMGASKLSRVWHPESWKGWDNTVISYGLWSASTVGFNIGREYYPDLVRKFRGRRNKP